MECARACDSPEVVRVRELAQLGQLAEVYASAAPTLRLALRRGVYEIARQVVFQRVTAEVERRRQHGDCARGPAHLRPDCLDRFHDAVEAVVDDTLRKATISILRLDGWMAARAKVVTIDDHRARRGRVGAQQKPSVPQWLRAELGHDPWLVDLALAMLTWVGIPDTAGPGIWPVDAWTDRRATLTGEYVTSDPVTVWREIETVLAAMRRRPAWYARYVERPLDHKPIAMAPAVRGEDGEYLEQPPLELVTAQDQHDAALLDLACCCLEAIRAGARERGRPVESVIGDAVRMTFGADQFAQSADVDADVDLILSDPAVVRRIVDAVLGILGR